jgi:hypothetical protein
MTLDQLIELLIKVLTSREVIAVTVAVALYVNVVNYIVHYRKKPPKPRKARVKEEKPKASEEADREDEDGGEE